MAVATMQITTKFVGGMTRETVLGYVDRLMQAGIDRDEAVTQTATAIIHAGRADDFVRTFGGTMIKGMLTNRETPKHPARYTPPERVSTFQSPDRDGGNGLASADAQGSLGAPPSPEPIPQTFPEPGTGRVLGLARLKDPRALAGVLAGKWVVDGERIPLGLLTPEQCFKLAESETRAGRTRVTNGTMFRRLGESLSPGQVVADRWDEAGIMTHFELAEPKL